AYIGSNIRWDCTQSTIALHKLTMKTNTPKAGINVVIKKISSVSTPLANTYQYLDVISNTAIKDLVVDVYFKVPISWINGNKINPDTLSLYKSGWTEITTTKLSVDDNYIYFKAPLSEFTTLAIAGDKLICDLDDKPSDDEWSSCAVSSDGKGHRSRTAYTCVDAEWVEGDEDVYCCPECPSSQSWGECIDGMKSRATYGCDDYACISNTEKTTCESPMPIPTDVIILVGIGGALVVAGVFVYKRLKDRMEEDKIIKELHEIQ
ncbi:MAG: PGF-pre-PGF domain-containing protein, partial [Candidatus Aenigmatarchaeota archaeon]